MTRVQIYSKLVIWQTEKKRKIRDAHDVQISFCLSIKLRRLDFFKLRKRRMFLPNFLIVITTTIVVSEGICRNTNHGSLECTDDKGLKISLEFYQNNVLIKCFEFVTDERVFNQLPVDNQSDNIYLHLEDCPMPNNISLLLSKYPSVSLLTIHDSSGNEINPDFFNEKANITELDLGRNSLEKLHHRTFTTLNHLETIGLNYNKFSELPSNLFDQNRNLKIFNLEWNERAMHLSDGILANKINLLWVSFYGTEIKFISTKLFANSINIEEINLTGTNLETVYR